MVTDPSPVGQRQDKVAVEPAGLAEVDVLDAGRVTEPGAAQPVGEPSSPHTARTHAVHTSFPLDAAALPLCLAPREAVKISQQTFR